MSPQSPPLKSGHQNRDCPAKKDGEGGWPGGGGTYSSVSFHRVQYFLYLPTFLLSKKYSLCSLELAAPCLSLPGSVFIACAMKADFLSWIWMIQSQRPTKLHTSDTTSKTRHSSAVRLLLLQRSSRHQGLQTPGPSHTERRDKKAGVVLCVSRIC